MDNFPSSESYNLSSPDSDEQLRLLYFLSSKTGFGHSSRAAAILNAISVPANVLFAANNKVEQFLDFNVSNGLVQHSTAPVYYHAGMGKSHFSHINRHAINVAQECDVVINDFLTQFDIAANGIRRQMAGQPLVGIYHSIEGYNTDDLRIRMFQEKYRKIASTHDYVFLTEPKAEHQNYQELPSGTVVIACDPVVRPITKPVAQVKQELGLAQDEDFLLIQSGMYGNKNFNKFIANLANFSINGLKTVLVASRMMDLKASNLQENGLIVTQNTHDAQNIMNAAHCVIAKPGMQTLNEAIGYRKPVLFFNDSSPEPQLKQIMLKELLGPDLPSALDLETSIDYQIKDWLESYDDIASRLALVPCNGAEQIATALASLAGAYAIENTA